MTFDEALVKLAADRERGLESSEAARRLREIGRNELPKKKPVPAWRIFLSQLKNPLVYILVVAAIFTAVIRDYVDFAIILSAVVINSLIGFFQEYKADRTLEALRGAVKFRVKIVRDGHTVILPVEEIVPGDLALLEEGDRVPADGRLFNAREFLIDESVLTGESLGVSKDEREILGDEPLTKQSNMAFYGTKVLRGRSKMIVVSTGTKTEFGRIYAALAEIKEERSPLGEKIYRLSRFLAIIFSGIAAVAFVIGLFQGRPLVETLITVIAMAVASVPEGLPAAVSIVLAVGMAKIYRDKGLIRRMSAAETLGAVTVVATDKTGTLTHGHLALEKIFSPDAADEEDVLKIGVLANDGSFGKDGKALGDPIDVAILNYAVHRGMMEKMTDGEERIDELPFSAERRYSASLNRHRGKKIIYIKGALETILEMSDVSKEKAELIWDEYNLLASQAYRILAVAWRETEADKLKEGEFKNFHPAGLLCFRDPLRADARHVINTFHEAGIRPILITGDSLETAAAIGKELGLDTIAFSGKEIEKMSDAELASALLQSNIFARILPLQKLRLVSVLQSAGEIVAMTGDGVNDAPALKKADIGVALGSGTEVAKEASDLIITDDNLKTVLLAIREGRTIFNNIRKILLYLLAGSFKEIILILGSIMMGLPLPLSAAQILWINLAEDSLPALSLAVESGGKNILKRPPRHPKEPIVNTEIKSILAAVIIIGNAGMLFLYWLLTARFGLDVTYARTIIFVALGVDSLFYVFACRHLTSGIWQNNIFGNKFLNLAVLFGFIMILSPLIFPPLRNMLGLYPLGVLEISLIMVFGMFNLCLIEIIKFFFRKIRKNA